MNIGPNQHWCGCECECECGCGCGCGGGCGCGCGCECECGWLMMVIVGTGSPAAHTSVGLTTNAHRDRLKSLPKRLKLAPDYWRARADLAARVFVCRPPYAPLSVLKSSPGLPRAKTSRPTAIPAALSGSESAKCLTALLAISSSGVTQAATGCWRLIPSVLVSSPGLPRAKTSRPTAIPAALSGSESAKCLAALLANSSSSALQASARA